MNKSRGLKHKNQRDIVVTTNCIQIQYLNSINELSVSIGLKKEIIKKYCINKKIKLIKDSMIFTDAEELCKHFNVKYKLDEICHVEEKLKNAALLKNPENINKITLGIVGHINHGKTTVVKKLININIEESYNITQNLHLYEGKDLFLIDTPGHEIFDFIREKIVDCVDCFAVVISLKEGIEKETEKIIKLLHAYNIEEKAFVLFTKSDVANHKPVDLMKLLESEYGFICDKYLSISYKDKDIYTSIYDMAKTFKKFEPDFDGMLINKQIIDCQPYYLIKLEKDILSKKSFLIFPDKVARVTKIKHIKNLKSESELESINFSYVCLDATVDKANKFFITCNEDLAYKYEKIINIKKYLEEAENKIQSTASKECSFVFLVSDNITKEAMNTLVEKFNIQSCSRIITHLDNITIASIDPWSTVIAFNYEFDQKIQKDMERTNTLVFFTSIYEVINFLSENVTDMATNTKVISVAQVLKSFDIKTAVIAGCKIIKGEFSMGDKVVVTVNQEEGKYTLKDAVEATVISLKKKDSFLKKTKLRDEVGIILSKFKDFKEGMCIVKLQGDPVQTRKRRRRK